MRMIDTADWLTFGTNCIVHRSHAFARYPNGNSNAKPGFCSLGLKAPHGAHLRYKLIVAGTEAFAGKRSVWLEVVGNHFDELGIR